MKIKPFGAKSLAFIKTPWREQARINILEGSVRSSKTVTLHPKTLELVYDGPQGLGIFTGVSKDTIYDNVLRDLFDLIGKENYRYNRQSGELWLYGDEWKVVGAKDEGSEKYIRGKTIGKAICDELSLMPERFLKQLLARMSIENARLYGTTNPDTPFHYLYKEYITDAEKLASGMVQVYHFDLDDNPNLSEEYKSFIRSAYKGVFFQRFILGKWVIAEGAIYKDVWSDDLYFDELPVGLINSYPNRYIGIDYGTTNPCVFVDIIDDGETLWQVREYYWDSKKEGKQKTDSEYADDLQEFLKGGAEGAEIIIDPSAASFKTELQNRGFLVLDADNDVPDGIRIVSVVLGQRKYRVHRSCIHTAEEMQAYAWDEKAAKRGEEKPLKEHDHAPDAIRYVMKTKMHPWRLAIN